MSAGQTFRDGLRSRAIGFVPPPFVTAAVSAIASRTGDALVGIVFFGSRRSGAARADVFSAYDLFVVVKGYRPFFRALHEARLIHRQPWLMAMVSRFLPPSQVSLVLGTPEEPFHAKCSVIDAKAFQRETSARRSDHFCIGRLFQPAAIVHAADDAARDTLLAGLESAHLLTLSWCRPWLPAAFDAAAYCLRLLEVSLSQEIRPEPAGRALALFTAQKGEIVPVYERVLQALAEAGDLRLVESGAFALARPVGAGERLGVRLYFARSKARATLRWAKHMVTFEGWLDYILRKVRRHGGGDIELTERERRMPLLFLWPRLFRYLRHKDR
jgi:predicted nucleotidyltransferase